MSNKYAGSTMTFSAKRPETNDVAGFESLPWPEDRDLMGHIRRAHEEVEAMEAARRKRELASLEAFAYRSGDLRLKNAVAFARLSFPALREVGGA